MVEIKYESVPPPSPDTFFHFDPNPKKRWKKTWCFERFGVPAVHNTKNDGINLANAYSICLSKDEIYNLFYCRNKKFTNLGSGVMHPNLVCSFEENLNKYRK